MPMLDIYDDPTASLLARRLAETGMVLQEKLASSRLLDSDELSAVPDRLFAFIEQTPDGGVLRKYAMHDEAHVLTSIVYFLECGKSLPAGEQTKIAEKLVNSCAWHDIEPPARLVKVALGQQVSNPPASWDPVEAALQQGNTRGHEYFPATPKDQKHQKKADLRGTSLGTQGMLSQDPRSPTPERKGLAQKTAALDFGEAKVACGDAREHYALASKKKYPIATTEGVKRASDYFERYARELSFADRREFAVNVAERAKELNVKVGSAIQMNSRTEYGDFIQEELWARSRMFEGHKGHETYELLREKKAEIAPAVMFDMLQKIDDELNLDRCYGRPGVGLRDPYTAVYGVKVATENVAFVWTHEGHHTTGPELETYAKQHPRLDRAFGPGFDIRFAKDPVTAFNSLSTPQKVVLCRLANEASRTP